MASKDLETESFKADPEAARDLRELVGDGLEKVRDAEDRAMTPETVGLPNEAVLRFGKVADQTVSEGDEHEVPFGVEVPRAGWKTPTGPGL